MAHHTNLIGTAFGLRSAMADAAAAERRRVEPPKARKFKRRISVQCERGWHSMCYTKHCECACGHKY